jgi:hypothetical protein
VLASSTTWSHLHARSPCVFHEFKIAGERPPAPSNFATTPRAGNTKTHDVLRAELRIRGDVPQNLPRNLQYAAHIPRMSAAGGHGTVEPPRYRRCQYPQHRDEGDAGLRPPSSSMTNSTEDFTGIRAPTFKTPNIVENAKLQAAILQGTCLFYFISPSDSHLLDGVMQGLWARTQTSRLETDYWSCVPYLLGEGQMMQYSFRPRSKERSAIQGFKACPGTRATTIFATPLSARSPITRSNSTSGCRCRPMRTGCRSNVRRYDGRRGSHSPYRSRLSTSCAVLRFRRPTRFCAPPVG